MMLYDRDGSVFELDHEIDGTAYLRPMVKVLVDVEGDTEDGGYEPASYLVMRPRAELFDEPPHALMDQEVADRRGEIDRLVSEKSNLLRGIEQAKYASDREIKAAERQLDEWMTKHKVMIDLGKLLDGAELFPLTVKENPYHDEFKIPRIPDLKNAERLILKGGEWTGGKAWRLSKRGVDNYGEAFEFFNTEEERTAEITTQFEKACISFRRNTSFSEEGRTYGSRLDFGTLQRWVDTHPFLEIPVDITAMKAEDDAAKLEARRAKLAAELANLGTGAS